MLRTLKQGPKDQRIRDLLPRIGGPSLLRLRKGDMHVWRRTKREKQVAFVAWKYFATFPYTLLSFNLAGFCSVPEASMAESWQDCPALGPGWKRRESFRKSGASFGRSDIYYQR